MPITPAPHPRLYIGADEHRRLSSERHFEVIVQADRRVRREANRFIRNTTLTYARDCHNEHLLRAREVQYRIVTLLTRWQQTGEARYRKAVVEQVRRMGEWEYWSWIAWRQGDAAPDAIFDLSYGENAATLAIAWDWLFATLDAEERDLFLEVARKWPLAAARKQILTGKAWYIRSPNSNWNTVCTGGLGMLLLAMYEEIEDAAELLAAVEDSIAPFFRSLDETNGGWPEGIGYWNYGMRYGFMYLLSHERSTGREHPFLTAKSVRQTLEFPLDFCPHGQSCSFGDVNTWTPLPFHYAAAARLGLSRVCQMIERRVDMSGKSSSTWPDAAEWLLFHTGKPVMTAVATKQAVTSHYAGLDWGILADTWPNPKLYLSIRGGTTKVPHGHLDLLSFHCVVGDERLITNLTPHTYYDSTFSSRRYDLFEMRPDAKNTLFINGVGITNPATLQSMERLRRDEQVGFRLVATEAMGQGRESAACSFCARLFLMVEQRVALIVDRVELPFVGLVENRMHTPVAVGRGRSGAKLRGKRQSMRVVYAASVPAIFRTGVDVPTAITATPTTVLRWGTTYQVKEATLITLLSPGDSPAALKLVDADGGLSLTVSQGDWQSTVALDHQLRFR